MALALAWAALAAAPPAWSQPQADAPPGTETAQFRIEAPPELAAEAAVFRARADMVLAALAGALELEPGPERVLRLWPEDASAQGIDPSSRPVEGILVPGLRPRRVIDLRLAAAGAAPPGDEALDNALRLPLAAQLLAEASGGRLPVAFQLGAARYFQAPDGQTQALVADLRAADLARPPTWTSLNRPGAEFDGPLRFQAWSLSVAHFLFARDGLSGLNRFLAKLRDGGGWRAGLAAAYGEDPALLEAAWRAWLPSYVNGGWRDHRLYGGSLEEARARMAAGDYRAASALLRASAPFLELHDRAAAQEATRLLEDARMATRARADLELARELLEAGGYASAATAAGSAAVALEAAGDGDGAAMAAEIARRADLGRLARARLERARSMRAWRALPAAVLAASAQADFARLGDLGAAREAGSLAAALGRLPRNAGAALATAGTLLLLWNIRRRRRPSPVRP